MRRGRIEFWYLEILTVALVVFLRNDFNQAYGRDLYVSKGHGDDTGSCQNRTSPCKTLKYVISKARTNDVIMMDAAQTASQPYDSCASQSINNAGNLSFVSWNGSAVVNCSGHGLVFTGNPMLVGNIGFMGLKIVDTYLIFRDVSITAVDCAFGSFLRQPSFLYIINFTIPTTASHVVRNITVRDSRLMAGNSAGFLSSTNSRGGSLLFNIEVRNTTMNSNSPENIPSLIYVEGAGNFVFVGLEVTNQSGSFSGGTQMNPSALTFASINFGESKRDKNFTRLKEVNQDPVNVHIDKATFSQNSNFQFLSLLYSTSQLVNVLITNTHFITNNGWGSSAIFFNMTSPVVQSTVLLEGCHFFNNQLDTGVAIAAAQLSVNIRSCVFQQNVFSSAIRSQIVFSLTIEDSHFLDSMSGYSVSGQIVSSVSIEDSHFLNNTAIYSGVSVVGHTSGGKVTVTRCKFLGNLAVEGGTLHLTNVDCSIADTTFTNNIGFQSAGAVYFTGSGHLVLNNCTLRDNFGGSVASTLALGSLRLEDGEGNATINNSRFIQQRFERIDTRLRVAFNGFLGMTSKNFGSINLQNTTFDFNYEPLISKFIIMETSLRRFMIADNATIIRCPTNCHISKTQYDAPQPSLKMVSYQCRVCAMGTYSRERGYYAGVNTRHSFKCFRCPHGAKCDERLESLPNFWGVETTRASVEPVVEFHYCPLGYCCQPSRGKRSCYPYNKCTTYRNGTLCGQCGQDYSETLFTPSCRRSEDCNDVWFWPLAVVFVLGFSVYLIAQPDIVTILWKKVTWFSRVEREDDHEESYDPGFERIIFFFYQAADILIVESPVNVWDNYLMDFVLGVFNFEVRVRQDGFACPFPGLSPVSKVFFRSFGVCSVVLGIPFIYLCHYLLCLCLKRRPPEAGSYLSAFIKAIVLGYAVLTDRTLRLLKCVTVNGTSCLFLNCNVPCYTWWQKIIGTLVAIYILPFVLVLFFGSYKLFNKKISVAPFIVACCFPLPVLSYWLLMRRRVDHVSDTPGRDAIMSVLTRSYRAPDHLDRGAIYWESALIGRILLLILANVLIHEPFLRSLVLVFLSVLILSIHTYVLPFEVPAANKAEMFSLFALVVLSITSIPHSGYLTEGVTPTGSISKVIHVFSWLQVALVAFLPFVLFLVLLAAVVSQAVRLACFLTKWLRQYGAQRCRCWRSRGHAEMSETLISN